MTSYQFARTYEGVATHCCLMMDLALDEQYLAPTVTFSWTAEQPLQVLPPHIEGVRVTKTGRKRKPNLLVNYCPWCGTKLTKEELTAAGRKA